MPKASSPDPELLQFGLETDVAWPVQGLSKQSHTCFTHAPMRERFGRIVGPYFMDALSLPH
jgi:hypothetical protein